MMSDRWGRRHNITLLAILFFFGAIGNAISPNVWVMYIFRALLGFAVGGASATVPVYLAETAPKRIRGAIVAVDQLMIVTGQLLTFSINALIATMRGGPELTVTADPSGLLPAEYISHAISFDTLALMQASRGGTLSTAEYHEFLAQLSVVTGNGDTWRYMIVLCSIPAIALWIGIRLMPESSSWYVAKDRLYEAIGALKRVRNEAVDGPLVEELADIATIHRAETSSERKGFGYVWRTPWLRKLMIVDIFPGTTNQLTGVNTVMYYAPKVLQYAGMDTSSAIVAQVANGVMSVVGSALGIWLTLKFRRRQILIADVIGMGSLRRPWPHGRVHAHCSALEWDDRVDDDGRALPEQRPRGHEWDRHLLPVDRQRHRRLDLPGYDRGPERRPDLYHLWHCQPRGCRRPLPCHARDLGQVAGGDRNGDGEALLLIEWAGARRGVHAASHPPICLDIYPYLATGAAPGILADASPRLIGELQ